MTFAKKYDITPIVSVNGIGFAYSKKTGQVFVMRGNSSIISEVSGKITMTIDEWEDEEERNHRLANIIANIA